MVLRFEIYGSNHVIFLLLWQLIHELHLFLLVIVFVKSLEFCVLNGEQVTMLQIIKLFINLCHFIFIVI